MKFSGSTYGLRRRIERCSTGSFSRISRWPVTCRIQRLVGRTRPRWRRRCGRGCRRRAPAGIAPRDAHIRLAQRDLRVVQHRAEKEPLLIHAPQLQQPFRLSRLREGGQRRAETVPAGQHEAALHPAEAPGNGPQPGEHAAATPPGRARADGQLVDLVNRRRLLPEGQEVGCIVDELAIGLIGDVPPARPSRRASRSGSAARARATGQQRGVDHLLQMSPGDGRLAVVMSMTSPCSVMRMRPPTEPAGWARIARFGRPAAAGDRAAPAVEQREPHVVLARRRRASRLPGRGRAPSWRSGSRRPCCCPSSQSSSSASGPGRPDGGRRWGGRRAPP